MSRYRNSELLHCGGFRVIQSGAADNSDGLRFVLHAHQPKSGWHNAGRPWRCPSGLYASSKGCADLGLRAASLTGSITVAAMSGRLRATLPTTADAGQLPDALAEDLAVGQALQVGQLWLRLAEHRRWAPLAGPESLRPLLAQLSRDSLVGQGKGHAF